MCRVYKANAGWFIRLCYYHRERKGEHVPVPHGYKLERQHYPRSGQTRSADSRRAQVLTFSVTSFTNQSVVNDMAQYAGAQVTWDEEDRTVTLIPKQRWHNVRPIIDRAVTFGWRRLDAGPSGRVGA